MMQLWVIVLSYLVYTALIFITPSVGIANPTLFSIRDYLYNNPKYLIVLSIIGFSLTLVSLFIPISPGPIFLGDLLPSIFLFVSAINYSLIYFKKEQSIIVEEKIIKRHRNYSIILLIVSFLHFSFPKWVLF